nr:MAG TPA: hypothetical protein [Caudoviricetes sp.]
MAIFGKKRELTKDELIEALNALSDDDKKDVIAKTTGEQVDEAKKDIEDKGDDSQSDKDRIDESVGEQEHLDGDEDSQDAKDRVDESEGEEKALDEDKADNADDTQDDKSDDDTPAPQDNDEAEDKKNLLEITEAQAARITALEEQFAELSERLSHVLDAMDNQPFGVQPKGDSNDEREITTDGQVMRSYNRAYRG